MNPIRLWIDRPIATTLVMLGILLFGLVGYKQLAVSDLPNVEFPTITVSANLPGANPGTMAASVATPLEAELSTIAGLDSMNSSSSLGSTSITLQFDLSRSIDAAAQDVQAAISTTIRKLPQNMPAPPSLRKVNPADQPIYFLTVASKTLPLFQVNEFADKMVSQRLSMVGGVAQVNLFGSQKYAVRIQLDPLLLSARNLGVDEVAAAIQQGNSNLPIGTVFADEKNYTIKSNGQLVDAAAYGKLIVAYRDGAPVYLADLAKVIDSVENTRQASWFNGERAVVLAIQKQPGTNTIQVIRDIQAKLPQIQADMPPAVSLRTLFDRSVSIHKSVDDVQFTLMLTIILVVLVIYLFLGNFSATWIASLALPMAIVGTFAIMALLGFSLNNLSLMALTLSVGFVIDDAIVVLENIMRHLEMGEAPFEAAIKGTREIGFTILSMTISLIAVFIPILFMGGLLGRLFNEFAVTMAAAILVSGFVSLSLTPMLCSRFLKLPHGRQNIGVRLSDRGFKLLAAGYRHSLGASLRFKPLVLLVFFGLCGATVWLFSLTPKGFMPTDDTGQLSGIYEAAQGTPFKDMEAFQTKAAAIARKNPNVAAVMSSIDGSNSGRLFIALKPFGQRKHVEEVVKQLRPKLASIPGIQAFLQIPQSIRLGGGRASKAAYQLSLLSPDTDALYKGTAELEKAMKEIPGLLDVSSDVQLKNPQVILKVDREKASALGLSQQQVESALSNAFGTRQISTIYAPTNDYQVILELNPAFQRNMDALNLMYVRSANKELVPVSTVATVERAVGPLTVNHLGPFPSTSLSFNLPPDVALGDVVSKIEATAAKTLPANVRTQFQGTAQIFQDSLQGLGWLLLLAVLVIYLVLGILYESFIHPITILSGLPPAGLGALLALLVFHQELNIYGFLGLILLIGIVKKNAIMMIDFALELQRKQAKRPQEAIHEAAQVRFRPIMMTTFAA
ncbi:MAG: efflux RND transporter permease subunit, partial [Candidatus Sericytochromatia bacterium]